jgi:O-antigen ligase
MFTMLIRLTLFIVGFTLPLEHLGSVVLAGVTVTPNKVAAAFLLGLAVLHRLASGRRLPRNPKNVWVGLFAVVLLASSVASLSAGTSAPILIELWTSYGALLLFYFLLCYLLHSRRDMDVLLWAVVLGAAFAGASATLGFGNTEPLKPFARWERSGGFGAGANQAAANLLMSIPLAVALLVTTRSRIRKAILLGAMGFLVAGIGASLSRSAFLAGLAMGGLWFHRFHRPEHLRLVIAALLLIVVAGLLAPDGYFERVRALSMLGSRRSRDYTSDLHRVRVYEAGTSAFLSHPLMGVGAGRFGEFAAKASPPLDEDVSVHNALGQIAVESGLLGLVPFLAIVILTWGDFARAFRTGRSPPVRADPDLRGIRLRAAFAQMGFLAILLVAQFQPGAFWRGIWMMFALSTALWAMARARVAQIEAQSVPRQSGDPAAVEVRRRVRTPPHLDPLPHG